MTKNKGVVQRVRADIIKMIRQKTRFTQSESKIALEAVLASIQDCLAKGEAVNLADFGKFHVTERSARIGRNPKTGESVNVGERKTTKFAAGNLLKNLINAHTRD